MYADPMHDDGSRKAFRVTVRGRFLDLSDEARLYLAGEQPEHDIFKSAYTVEGTFTYDARIDFFNLRYELRVSGDSPAESASAQGLHEAELCSPHDAIRPSRPQGRRRRHVGNVDRRAPSPFDQRSDDRIDPPVVVVNRLGQKLACVTQRSSATFTNGVIS